MGERTEGARVGAPVRYRSYPAYRDSGVEWLGEVPEGWEVRRLKTFATARPSNVDKKSEEGQQPVRLCNYVDVYKNEFITPDLDFMSATATPAQVRDFRIRPGDVIATKDSETADDIAVPALSRCDEADLVCGYHLTLIRPAEGAAHGPFLFRAMQAVGPSDQFRFAANGVTRFGLPVAAFTEAVFPLPPLPEQRAIAAFLDRETARIDTLVEKKERLLELLDEKRTALISRAVTKGLDPDVPMRDSGVEWLGEVPEGWEVVPLKQVAMIQNGITLGQRDRGPDTISRPYLRVANVQDGYLDLTDVSEIEIPAAHAPRYELQHRDVVVTEGGDFDKLGRGHVWQSEIDRCLHQNHIFAVRCDQARLLPEFLAAVTTTLYGRAYFTATSKQSTNLASTNRTKLGGFPLPLPPLPTQRAIAAYLDRETTRVDALKTKVRKAIDLLKEYRTALISAAVTGKIDVRGEVEEVVA